MYYRGRSVVHPQLTANSPVLIHSSPDFNICPDDPAYAILVGDQWTEKQRSILNASLVVHATVDPSIQRTHEKRPIDVDSEEESEEGETQGQATGQTQTGGQEQAASTTMPNTRPAEPRDGLLSEQELRAIARSVYLTHAGACQ